MALSTESPLLDSSLRKNVLAIWIGEEGKGTGGKQTGAHGCCGRSGKNDNADETRPSEPSMKIRMVRTSWYVGHGVKEMATPKTASHLLGTRSHFGQVAAQGLQCVSHWCVVLVWVT